MREFGNMRFIRAKSDEKGKPGKIIGEKLSPVQAMTRGELDGSFGQDRDKKLIVSLEAGDLISVRPVQARSSRAYKISAFDLYRWAIQATVRRLAREKSMLKRSKKAERLARARQARAEKKLTQPIE